MSDQQVVRLDTNLKLSVKFNPSGRTGDKMWMCPQEDHVKWGGKGILGYTKILEGGHRQTLHKEVHELGELGKVFQKGVKSLCTVPGGY